MPKLGHKHSRRRRGGRDRLLNLGNFSGTLLDSLGRIFPVKILRVISLGKILNFEQIDQIFTIFLCNIASEKYSGMFSFAPKLFLSSTAIDISKINKQEMSRIWLGQKGINTYKI